MTTRLSIEITPEQKQQIKALASLQGLSVKDYILKQSLPEPADEEDPWAELRAFFAPRIADAKAGIFSPRTIDDIIADADARLKSRAAINFIRKPMPIWMKSMSIR